MKMILICLCLVTSGCAWLTGIPRIKAGNNSVVGIKDSGKPAMIDSSVSEEAFTLPAGTQVIETKYEAIPATANSSPVAARSERTYTVASPVEIKRTTTAVSANTGTVDTSLAKHRIDVEQNRWLLWAAIACVPIAIFFVYIKYPTPALYCGAAAVVFFIAWKVAGLPEWVQYLGFAGLVAGVVMWRAHNRGEQDAIKSIIEPKNGNPVITENVPLKVVEKATG